VALTTSRRLGGRPSRAMADESCLIKRLIETDKTFPGQAFAGIWPRRLVPPIVGGLSALAAI
jgi:hypothetical protein